jgi:hypothetical protein
MALKGKPKSGTRGSQGRKRPATAPRPAPVAARDLPWRHTNSGRLVIALVIALVVGLVWWAISTAQTNAERRDARQETLNEYTGQIRTVSQAITEAAGEMAAVPPTPDEAALAGLGDSSTRWAKAFTDAQAPLVETFPPSQSLQRANGLFQQSLQLYDSSARTYGLVPRAEGKLQTDLLARAAAQRDQAAAIWAAAVAFIDAARTGAELDASGIATPGSEAAATQPTELPSVVPSPAPAETEGGG